jgi:pterin-4a-carbinolamine dehydratase
MPAATETWAYSYPQKSTSTRRTRRGTIFAVAEGRSLRIKVSCSTPNTFEAMKMAEISIFISYRRDDDALRSALLDRIVSGAFNEPGNPSKVLIYRDTSQRLGVTWPKEVRERCGSADIVLVVIGPKWLEARDQFSRRRIDQPDDWVRQEIELAQNSTVIPIAFGGAQIPPRQALPESIAYLAEKQGVKVRDEALDFDLQPVLLEIERHLPNLRTRDSYGDSEPGNLLPYPRPPLLIKPAPMSEEDVTLAVREVLQDWKVVEGMLPEDPSQDRIELHRTFLFRSFRDVLAFMTEIGDFADKANHHPRWENIFRTLRVYLTTWDIGHRISQLDVQLAQYFDRAYRRYRESAGAQEK